MFSQKLTTKAKTSRSKHYILNLIPNLFFIQLMRKLTTTTWCSIVLLFLLTHAEKIVAQTTKLLSPNEFLPHRLGEQFTPHNWLTDYFHHVANATPDRVQLREYGRTNEGRPLLLAAISTPQNIKNLEQIRFNNLRRARLLTDKQADNSNNVAILWISMNVHGNEPSSSETSMALLHRLVNGEDKNVEEWLKNTVVLIDPCLNPDGYHRYTFWHNGVCNRAPNPAPEAREHQEPWPYGRSNHYLFDLNRDWAWATQTETKARLEVYHQWMPQVHPDFHEMGYNNPYYFAPAAQPYHTYITSFQREFQKEVGKNHAKYFDANHWLYFTKEVFDLFYPSYGDTYPTFNGAIGMTYEQGGIRAGRAILLENGDTLTLKDRITHHLTTALSTLEVTSKNATRLIQHFEQFFKKNIENPTGTRKTFIIKSTNARDKLSALCQLFDRHKIKYGSIKASVNSTAYDYVNNKETPLSISPEDLIVSAHQPLGLLAQVLLEPESELVDSLTYDITAWSLIHAFGVEGYASKERLDPTKNFELPKLTPLEKITDKNRPYAYIAEWKALGNARFLSYILQKGIKARAASEPFEVEGRKCDRGTLIITRAENIDLSEKFDKIIAEAANLFEQEVIGVQTGFVVSGYDFGSEKQYLLTAPRVAIIYDEDLDVNAYGQVWSYFEQDIHYPITQLHTSQLTTRNLRNYTLIVLADSRYSALDTGAVERLRQWVIDGGRLVLIGDGMSAVEDKKGFALTRYAIKKDREWYEDFEMNERIKRRFAHFCDAERNSLSEGISGAIVKVTLDNSHPLAFGLPNYYYSLKTQPTAYQALKGAWNVGYIGGDLVKFGFIGSKVREPLKYSMNLAVQDMGRGNVIYMQDNPLFRAFWYQGKFIFSNAVFMKMR